MCKSHKCFLHPGATAFCIMSCYDSWIELMPLKIMGPLSDPYASADLSSALKALPNQSCRPSTLAITNCPFELTSISIWCFDTPCDLACRSYLTGVLMRCSCSYGWDGRSYGHGYGHRSSGGRSRSRDRRRTSGRDGRRDREGGRERHRSRNRSQDPSRRRGSGHQPGPNRRRRRDTSPYHDVATPSPSPSRSDDSLLPAEPRQQRRGGHCMPSSGTGGGGGTPRRGPALSSPVKLPGQSYVATLFGATLGQDEEEEEESKEAGEISGDSLSSGSRASSGPARCAHVPSVHLSVCLTDCKVRSPSVCLSVCQSVSVSACLLLNSYVSW